MNKIHPLKINKMKKKLIFISSSIFFSMILVTNIHLSTNNYRISLLLSDLTVMAKADVESGEKQKCKEKTWQFYECYPFANGYDCSHLTDPDYYGFCNDVL